MLRTVARPVRFSLLASCVACCLFLAAAAIARADEPVEYTPPADRALEPKLPELAACPNVVPPGIEAEEVEEVPPEIVELAHIRREAQETCKAETDRLDQVIHRLWWVTAQTLALDHSDPVQAETNEWLEHLSQQDDVRSSDLHFIRESLSDVGSFTLRSLLVGPEDEKPLPVSGGGEGGGEGTEELVAAVDAAGEASQAGLYLIAGLLAGLFVAACLWKVVDRGT